MARPRVALIIPTLNEEEAIGGVLAAVPRDAVDEIIVADSGSIDRTAGAAMGAPATPAPKRQATAMSWSSSTATAAIGRN